MGDRHRIVGPGPKKPVDLGVAHCAADGCNSVGLALPAHTDEGQLMPKAPWGWRQIVAVAPEGHELVLFVCSPACERRLAMKLTTSRLGSLDG